MFLYHVMRDVFFKKCRKKGSFLVHASNSHSVCLSQCCIIMLQLQAIVVTITTCNMRYEFEIMEEKKNLKT